MNRLHSGAIARSLVVLLVSVGAISAAPAAEPPAADAKPIRRYGLFIGANDGGPGRERLLYAASDCRSFAKVLEEVGGLSEQDAVVLVDPDATEVRRRLGEMQARIQTERGQARRVEFVLYYSGHSDEESLMMGQSRLGYGELRESLTGIGADISLAILDSCASGAFIRLKGGQRRAPFLVDESSEVQGQAYLTSSSEDEASQESDSLGGSFFTHALISALRGAADFSLDGKVTLHEAYQYASQETLARTENTQAGPQHPSWYINLNGTGDLVLTDLRSTTAGLTMSEDVSGAVYIRDDRGKLVAEVRKSPGTPLTLALPPGSYTVTATTETRSLEARVTLLDGKWAAMKRSDFRDAPKVATRSRGDAPADATSDGVSEDAESADAERARELVQGIQESNVGTILGELGKQIGERARKRVEEALAGVTGTREPGADGADGASGGSSGDASQGWTRAETSREATPEGVRLVPLSIGFVPGLSFPYAGEARKILSLNALIGTSYAIVGFEASGILSITSRDVSGGQASGIGNIVSGNLYGFQAGGVFNMTSGRVMGFQSAGVFNYAKGGGGALQTAGVFNMVEGNLLGAQLAGVTNRAPGLRGLQAAGVFNMADGEGSGAQLAGVFNYATTFRGVQVATANAASQMHGLQVGVVNVAGSARGVQIGVVNVAGSLAGVPVGLVNIVGDGVLLFSVGWDARGTTSIELVSGKGLYTVLSAGARLGSDWVPTSVTAMAGMGVHVPVGPFYVEAEVGARNDFGVPPTSTLVLSDLVPFPQVRARAGVLLFGRIGGYVGYAVDVLVGLPWVHQNTLAHVGQSLPLTIGGVGVTLYPRVFAGISIGRQPGS